MSNDSAFKLISQEPLTISADAAWPRRRGDRMSTGMTAPGQGLPCWATDRSSGISPESGGAPAGAAAMGGTGRISPPDAKGRLCAWTQVILSGQRCNKLAHSRKHRKK